LFIEQPLIVNQKIGLAMLHQYHVYQVVSSYNGLLKKPKDTENVILSVALHRMVYRA